MLLCIKCDIFTVNTPHTNLKEEKEQAQAGLV